MWCPPTPPTTDDDVYIDYSLGFLYGNTPMSEAQLPPIYVKKERKRCRVETGLNEDGECYFYYSFFIQIFFLFIKGAGFGNLEIFYV